jgi:MFS family permease
MAAYGRLLRNRPFATLWLGATASLIGDALTWVSLVWLTIESGGTAIDIAVLAVCYTGPVMVGGLLAGLLLDRFDRRRLLIADNVIRGLAMLSVPVAAALGVLGQLQLDLVAVVYGLLYMVSLAGFPSILPDLVPDEDLATANAMESLSFGVGGVAGPALAGLLIGVIGAAANLAIDAASYGIFVACLLAVRIPPPAQADRPAAGMAPTGAVPTGAVPTGAVPTGAVPTGAVPTGAVPTGAGRSARGLRPALRFIGRTPAILAITVMFMAANVGEGMLTVLLPVYSREILGADAAGYGILISVLTAGALAGSTIIGGIRWPWPLGRSIAAAQLAVGAAALGLVPLPPFGVAAVVLFAIGICSSPLTIWAQTIRMRLIPAELRGRVFALLRTLMQSTPPAGGLAAGLLLAAGGASAVTLVIAFVVGVPGLVGLLHPALSGVGTEAPQART